MRIRVNTIFNITFALGLVLPFVLALSAWISVFVFPTVKVEDQSLTPHANVLYSIDPQCSDVNLTLSIWNVSSCAYHTEGHNNYQWRQIRGECYPDSVDVGNVAWLLIYSMVSCVVIGTIWKLWKIRFGNRNLTWQCGNSDGNVNDTDYVSQVDSNDNQSRHRHIYHCLRLILCLTTLIWPWILVSISLAVRAFAFNKPVEERCVPGDGLFRQNGWPRWTEWQDLCGIWSWSHPNPDIVNRALRECSNAHTTTMSLMVQINYVPSIAVRSAVATSNQVIHYMTLVSVYLSVLYSALVCYVWKGRGFV